MKTQRRSSLQLALLGTSSGQRDRHRPVGVLLGVVILLASVGAALGGSELGASANTGRVSAGTSLHLPGIRHPNSTKPPVSARALSVTTYSPPSWIPDNCSTDVTADLNYWFALLPTGATANLPHNACYLVSNSNSSLLTLHDKAWLTINGNGTTFKQDTFNNLYDPQSPVLTIGGDVALIVNDVTLEGPTSNGGWFDEGDAGILMWQNYAVQLNGVTITDVEGDGLDVYPLNNDPGVNWYVRVDDSTIENVGYKAVVPEAADHFTIENSTLSSADIDAEVDFSCQGDLPNCGTMAIPSIGLENMAIVHDSFPNGLALEDGMSCMPVGNWTISDNNFGTGGLVAQFDTTYNLTLSALQQCGRQVGLTIEGNTSTDSQPPCCGAGSPYVLLQGWQNVTIANNHLVFDLNTGLVGGPVVEFWGDTNVSITNNAFVNMYNLTLSDAPSGWPATVGVTTCGNTTGAAQYPVTSKACA
jgi:hypothetical protein